MAKLPVIHFNGKKGQPFQATPFDKESLNKHCYLSTCMVLTSGARPVGIILIW